LNRLFPSIVSKNQIKVDNIKLFRAATFRNFGPRLFAPRFIKCQMKDWGRFYASVLFCQSVALLIGSGYQKLLEVDGLSSMTARSASTIWHWDFVI
jgi:hypothetical protein